jgi:ERCC4-related helicase
MAMNVITVYSKQEVGQPTKYYAFKHPGRTARHREGYVSLFVVRSGETDQDLIWEAQAKAREDGIDWADVTWLEPPGHD